MGGGSLTVSKEGSERGVQQWVNSITTEAYHDVRKYLDLDGFPDKDAMGADAKNRSLFVTHFLKKALAASCAQAGSSKNTRSSTCGSKCIAFEELEEVRRKYAPTVLLHGQCAEYAFDDEFE